MEAKDTVMKVTKTVMDDYSHTEKYEVGDMDNPITVKEREWDLDRLLEAQAEISFKAGREEENTQAYHVGLYDGLLRGRREVAEWLEEQNLTTSGLIAHIKLLDWQAKLKEWTAQAI